jgi:hypothetical protein
MTKRIWVLLLAFLGCASTQPPRAAATAPAESPKFEVGPGPYNIELDAGPGRYEERFIQVPDGAFTLKGFIQFITVSKDRKWAPLAAIELMGPKESYNVGLEAFVHSNEPGKKLSQRPLSRRAAHNPKPPVTNVSFPGGPNKTSALLLRPITP